MTETETFTYYVGDLAYVLTDEEWEIVCPQIVAHSNDETDFQCFLEPEQFDVLSEHSGMPLVVMPTMFGDGCYLDRHGREYSVDSGTIGLINTNYLQDTDLLRKALEQGLGHLITVSEPIDASECYYEEGVLCFGGMHKECVEIDTEC